MTLTKKLEIKYLITEEAADLLRMHKRTLQRARHPEKYPKYAELNKWLNPSRNIDKGRGTWLYPSRNIELWLKRNSANGLTPDEIDEVANIMGELSPSSVVAPKKVHQTLSRNPKMVHFEAPQRGKRPIRRAIGDTERKNK